MPSYPAPQVDRSRGAPPDGLDGAAIVLARLAEHLRQCRAGCHDGCGAGERLVEAIVLAEDAVDLVREMIVSPSPAGGYEPADESRVLTSRELQVVALICRGMSNRRIGTELFVSESTVKFHVHNLLRKLGVRTRAEIAYQATRADLLRPPGSAGRPRPAALPGPRGQNIWS
jgi:DNA-binding CsgD family transcriptional regulator